MKDNTPKIYGRCIHGEPLATCEKCKIAPVKDEDTEQKARFFAQYINQKVFMLKNWHLSTLPRNLGPERFDELNVEYGYLLLTSLYSITKEDKKYIRQLMPDNVFDNTNMTSQFLKCLRDSRNWLMGNNPDVQDLLHAASYLHSKGYALPWNGVLVKEQISRGWIKLKQK